MILHLYDRGGKYLGGCDAPDQPPPPVVVRLTGHGATGTGLTTWHWYALRHDGAAATENPAYDEFSPPRVSISHPVETRTKGLATEDGDR